MAEICNLGDSKKKYNFFLKANLINPSIDIFKTWLYDPANKKANSQLSN